ncbi:uncharacterized protein LOC111717132, partial [Eurytemora carolleeae]|uniref:uncharacterized protein LOC111717132 n=1 Tax=Eurytemora carolleeae TaxID=1294199 RepID=UPI000C765DDC
MLKLVSALFFTLFIGSASAQCCQKKTVSGHENSTMDGEYRLTNYTVDDRCKDDCIYFKFTENPDVEKLFCFKAVPLTEAPTVDCGTISESEINAAKEELAAATAAEEALQAILALIASLRRMKRSALTTIPDSQVCDKIVELMDTAATKDDIKVKLPILLKIKALLERGVDCSSIKQALQTKVAAEKTKVAAVKAKAAALVPPPPTTKAPTKTSKAATTTEA